MNGRVFLTDPWFASSGPAHHLFGRRIFPLPMSPESIDRCDAMLISHNHIDHLSRHAFEIARKNGSVMVGPSAVVKKARRRRISKVAELRPKESFAVSGVVITGIPAAHPLTRRPVGFLLKGERTVYFSGDTRFEWAIVDHLRAARVDVAILQVSCAFYPWLSGADGMDMNYAEELARAIRPRCVIPMHFDCAGKYLDIFRRIRVSGRNFEVEDALQRFARRLSAYGIDCAILYPGQTYESS